LFLSVLIRHWLHYFFPMYLFQRKYTAKEIYSMPNSFQNHQAKKSWTFLYCLIAGLLRTLFMLMCTVHLQEGDSIQSFLNLFKNKLESFAIKHYQGLVFYKIHFGKFQSVLLKWALYTVLASYQCILKELSKKRDFSSLCIL